MTHYCIFPLNDATATNSITNCLSAINKWMNDNFLKLNEDKTEVLLCGLKSKREMLTKNLGGLTPLNQPLGLKPKVTSLGEIPDSDLNLTLTLMK